MISKILYTLLLATLLVVPYFLYKSHCRFMTRFYLKMIALVAARKLYRLLLLIVLLAFHFLHICVHSNDIGVIGSTIAFAAFYAFMDVDKWLHKLHEKQESIGIAFIAIMVFGFTPYLFTMAASLSFLLLAAQFYPSLEVLARWQNPNDRKLLIGNPVYLANLYY